MSSDSGSADGGEARGMNRRRFIKGSAVGAAAVAAMGLPQVAGVASAQGGGQPMTMKVTGATVTVNDTDDVAYFIVVGDIVEVDGAAATGVYLCRGVIFPFSTLVGGTPDPDADTHVDQRFRIDGVGSIFGAGSEGDGAGEPLGILGGTGRFIGAHGTYNQTNADGPIPLGTGVLEFGFNIRRG